MKETQITLETQVLLNFHHVFCLCFGCRYCFSHFVVFLPATMGFGEPNPTYSVNRRGHCGLISDLQELIQDVRVGLKHIQASASAGGGSSDN